MPLEGDPAAVEQAGQLFDQVHRAVLAARAADGYGHVAAVVACQRIQPVGQKPFDVIKHLRHVGVFAQGRRPPARHGPSVAAVWLVVRVGQHAHIKHIVGVHGDAALEGKRLEHQRQLAGGAEISDLT
jgi:hypothetical protein